MLRNRMTVELESRGSEDTQDESNMALLTFFFTSCLLFAGIAAQILRALWVAVFTANVLLHPSLADCFLANFLPYLWPFRFNFTFARSSGVNYTSSRYNLALGSREIASLVVRRSAAAWDALCSSFSSSCPSLTCPRKTKIYHRLTWNSSFQREKKESTNFLKCNSIYTTCMTSSSKSHYFKILYLLHFNLCALFLCTISNYY